MTAIRDGEHGKVIGNLEAKHAAHVEHLHKQHGNKVEELQKKIDALQAKLAKEESSGAPTPAAEAEDTTAD